MLRTPQLTVLVASALFAGSLVASATGSADLRIMPTRELVAKSVLIARARVDKTDESDWADFRQVAKLELVDVIEGDFTLDDVRVAGNSYVANTADKYKKKEEWLVFLIRDGGLYRTLNYQHGRFRIDGDVVRGWRDAEDVISDKPYYSVREEIEVMLTELKSPPEPFQPAGEAPAAPDGSPNASQSPGQPPVKPKSAPPKVTRVDRP